jgi:hypothetical protein
MVGLVVEENKKTCTLYTHNKGVDLFAFARWVAFKHIERVGALR